MNLVSSKKIVLPNNIFGSPKVTPKLQLLTLHNSTDDAKISSFQNWFHSESEFPICLAPVNLSLKFIEI